MKDIKKALQVSEKQLRTVIEKNPDSMIIVDKDGIVLFLNEAAMFLFNRKKEDLLGKPFAIPIASESMEIDIIRAGKELGEVGTGDMRVTEIEWEGKPAYLASIRDITELKQTEQLKSRVEELQKLDQLKSDFVSTVSHELRTPLAITSEAISLVMDGIVGPIEEKQKDLLKISKENLTRLSNIINDLLDISKIEAGRLELRRGMTDLTKLVGKLTDSYQTVVAPKKITLTSRIPEESLFVFIDEDKIIQAFYNLINNATKFTKEGGTIEITVCPREDDVLCSVKDNGIGMSQEDMKKLFGKFQQFGRTAGSGAKGTGLGLAITKALIELHGGKIWAESEEGEGTTFFISLPSYEMVIKEFNDLIDETLKESESEKKEASLLILDLKNSKEISTDFDETIVMDIINKMIATIGKVAARPRDRALIYDEHTIYVNLPETNKAGGLTLAKRIKEEILANKYIYDKKEVKLDIKIGVATYPEDAVNRDDLIRLAKETVTKPKTVLIVDDHPQIVRILQMRLESIGYTTRCAFNGKEALASLEEQRPDLIILDIVMPEMNGYEVFGRLKEDPGTASIPVVMLTAHDVDLGKLESALPGSVPVVQKTGGFENVVDIVEELT